MGSGEMIRILLNYLEVPFDDFRYTKEELRSAKENKEVNIEFGDLPVI